VCLKVLTQGPSVKRAKCENKEQTQFSGLEARQKVVENIGYYFSISE
jgi:hypothetical protein